MIVGVEVELPVVEAVAEADADAVLEFEDERLDVGVVVGDVLAVAVVVPEAVADAEAVLVRDGVDRERLSSALASGLVALCGVTKASSVHVTFARQDEWQGLAEHGFLPEEHRQRRAFLAAVTGGERCRDGARCLRPEPKIVEHALKQRQVFAPREQRRLCRSVDLRARARIEPAAGARECR